MKRGTIKHPKTKKLAQILKIPLAQAVGHLEALWHFTASYAIQGDIGRWSDSEIAEGCLWEKETSKFIEAIIEAGWVDRDDAFRLLTHDWEEHSEQGVKKTLDNRGLDFFHPTGWKDSNHLERNFPSIPGVERSGEARSGEGGVGGTKGFEIFWAYYPKKKSRGQAEKAWAVLKPTEQLVVEILQGVERAKKSEDWRKDGGQFIPFPATWLRAKGWLDEFPKTITDPKTGIEKINPVYRDEEKRVEPASTEPVDPRFSVLAKSTMKGMP